MSNKITVATIDARTFRVGDKVVVRVPIGRLRRWLSWASRTWRRWRGLPPETHVLTITEIDRENGTLTVDGG